MAALFMERRHTQIDGPATKGSFLLELVLVIAFVGIIAASSIPRVNCVIAKHRLHYAAKQLFELIENYGARSPLRGADVRIYFDTGTNTVFIIPASEISSPDRQQYHKLQQMPLGVRILSARFGNFPGNAAILTLRKDGSASPGIVVLKNNLGQRCVVTLSLRGARRLECSG
jgi:hypothetical protein